MVLNCRQDFPILKQKLTYLDSAATAQKPQVVIDTLADFYRHHYGTVHRSVYALAAHATEMYQQARQKVQSYLNASKPEEVIFTRGTTESINFIAYSFGKAFMQPGDEVILSEIEHHSNIVPWQILAEDRQIKIRVIPVNDQAELDIEAYKKLLSDKTKLVSVGHVSNAFGTIHPVKKIIELAHAKGAKVLIDGAQAAPHMPVDVQDLDADFYVFSGHKALGPNGIGILYGKEELLDAMPPAQGGGDMIEHVTFERTEYNTLPLKFEAGTPIIAEAIALGAAVDYIEKCGRNQIHQWEQELLHYALDQLKTIDRVILYGPDVNRAAIISFNIEGAHHLDVGTFLDLKGVAVRTGHHCTQPAMQRFGIPGTVRASFALYNTRQDVDHFISALNETLQKI